MSTYRKKEYTNSNRREERSRNNREYRDLDNRVECFKCKEVGHVAKNCTRRTVTENELLYDVDRVKVNFRHSKFTEVRVTCPEFMCAKCKHELRRHIIINGECGSNFLEFYNRKQKCGCIKPMKRIQPVDEFKDLGLDQQLQENITENSRCGFLAPTPIQRYAPPIITEGFDVMGCAQTGTGKTAAYTIPMVKFIKDRGYKKNPTDSETPQRPEVLILAPTRELVAQIDVTTRKLTNGIDPAIGVCMVYGKDVEEKIREGCNILVSTTGRILQLIEQGLVTLDNIKFLVLDELDKMLDMGFGPDIETILEKTGIPSMENRQTLLFSATFRYDLRLIARKCLKRDHNLIVAEGINLAQPVIEQQFYMIEDDADDNNRMKKYKYKINEEKLTQLNEILLELMLEDDQSFSSHHCWKTEDNDRRNSSRRPTLKDYLLHVLGRCSKKKILIFVETREAAGEIAKRVSKFLFLHLANLFATNFESHSTPTRYDYDTMNRIAINCGAIEMSRNLKQHDRKKNLDQFKDGVYPIMVSTNVLARGIDIVGVTHVVNFDMPVDLRRIPRILEKDRQAYNDKEIDAMPVRNQYEEYIHRIGRTGRAGNPGKSISFFQRNKDKYLATDLVKMLSELDQDVPKWLEEIAGQQAIIQEELQSLINRRLVKLRQDEAVEGEEFVKVKNEQEKEEQLKNILQTIFKKGDKTFWNRNHKCPTKYYPGQTQSGHRFLEYLSHILGVCAYQKIIIFVDNGKAEKVAKLVFEHLLGVLVTNFKVHEGVKLDEHELSRIDDFHVLYVDEKINQSDQKDIVNKFEEGKNPIFVCTNEIVRGIDITGVSHIINYDLPQDFTYFPKFRTSKDNTKSKQSAAKNLLHRIWSGKKDKYGGVGETISFFQPNIHDKLAKPLLEMLRKDRKLKIPRWLLALVDKQDQERQARLGASSSATHVREEWDEAGGVGAQELWGDAD